MIVKGGGMLGHGAEQKCTSRSSVFSMNVTQRWVSAGAVSRGARSVGSRRQGNRRLRVWWRLACSA